MCWELWQIVCKNIILIFVHLFVCLIVRIVYRCTDVNKIKSTIFHSLQQGWQALVPGSHLDMGSWSSQGLCRHLTASSSGPWHHHPSSMVYKASSLSTTMTFRRLVVPTWEMQHISNSSSVNNNLLLYNKFSWQHHCKWNLNIWSQPKVTGGECPNHLLKSILTRKVTIHISQRKINTGRCTQILYSNTYVHIHIMF